MSNIIRGLRSLKGLTQEDVAKELEITIRTYSKKESDTDLFTVGELRKLAKLFCVDISVFFEEKVTVTATK